MRISDLEYLSTVSQYREEVVQIRRDNVSDVLVGNDEALSYYEMVKDVIAANNQNLMVCEEASVYIVAAPNDADLSKIQELVLKRARWIQKQQQYFQQFLPRTPARSYLSGETHLYLGRQYRIELFTADKLSFKLSGFIRFGRTCQATSESIPFPTAKSPPPLR